MEVCPRFRILFVITLCKCPKSFLSVVYAHVVKYFAWWFFFFIMTPNLQVRVGGVSTMIVVGWYRRHLFTYFCRFIVLIFVCEGIQRCWSEIRFQSKPIDPFQHDVVG